MDELKPETTFDRAVSQHMVLLQKHMKATNNIVEQLEKMFHEQFDTALSVRVKKGEIDAIINLELPELTQSDIVKLNEISSAYVITPSDDRYILVQILNFKGVGE